MAIRIGYNVHTSRREERTRRSASESRHAAIEKEGFETSEPCALSLRTLCTKKEGFETSEPCALACHHQPYATISRQPTNGPGLSRSCRAPGGNLPVNGLSRWFRSHARRGLRNPTRTVAAR